eukprot:3199260-Pyramimonas_sp.AAC.1
MFSLQCLMLTPFDAFYAGTQHIPRTVDLYADDITVGIRVRLQSIADRAAKALRLLLHVREVLGFPPARHKMKVTSSHPFLGR